MTAKSARRDRQPDPALRSARFNHASLTGHAALLEASRLLAAALGTLKLGLNPTKPIFAPAQFDGTPIGALAERLALCAFERDALILLAGVNLSSPLSDALQQCGYGAIDFALMLTLLSEDHALDQRRIASDAPLRHMRLLHFADAAQQTQPINLRPLNLDEWVFMALLGHVHLDEVLARVAYALPKPAISFTQTQTELINRAVSSEAGTLLQISGSEPELRRHLAHGIAGATDLYALDAAQLEAGSLEDVSVRWNRFARLTDAALLLEIAELSVGESAGEDPRLRAAKALASRLEGRVLVSTRTPLAWGRTSLSLEIERPSSVEQRALWRNHLEVAGLHWSESLTSGVSRLSGQFDFTGSLIARASSQALGHVADRHDPDALGSALWNASLSLVRPRLEGLTQRITPAERADWSRLILPDAELNSLKRLVAHVRERQQVFETWGWQRDSSRGFGISALFGGPSGTGKTFSAEIIARQLGVDLQRIELPSIVSKYIGESEKLLSKLFDAAEYGGCVLLFDEADAIFGKRSEVKDSNDRYANLEVSYLLQRMESFRGLVILTTNQESNMDSAFLRRLRFVVHYPSPDATARERLWRGIFPLETPTDDLRFERLAQLEVSGGNIRNIALNAAFNASSEGNAVQMRHIHGAALEEVRKLKRLPRPGEFDGWM